MVPTAADDRVFAPRPLIGWALFTLTAGFVNGAAVMACNSFVTHITGNVTSIALDGSAARAFLLVAAAFIVGAMFSVLMAETMKKTLGVGFVLPVLVSFAVLIGISTAGRNGAFGPFGASSKDGPAFVMLGFLAAAMGMVNASIATATANKIRITHLTGPATDLAGNLVRAALDAGDGARVELRWAALRFAKLVAFGLGAALAARVAGDLQYDVFAAAALILILAIGFAGAPGAAEAAPRIEGGGEGDDQDVARADTPRPITTDIDISRCEDALPPLPPIPRPPVEISAADDSRRGDRDAAE
jgi:uncharacterized membrane protein YoaK (UPF0700 family)